MASLPPLDWQHIPHYVALLVGCAAFFALNLWHERRDCLRKAAAVRPKLASERYRHCGRPARRMERAIQEGRRPFL